jgi:CRISPR/Cas system-associated exonuclease Cas4 (RecB family)
MKPFLELSAEYIFEKYKNKLEKLVILLPSKRACFFFKKYLSTLADEPVWSPRILTIDDFIIESSELSPIDPVQLLWLLYDVFKETDPNLRFDRFTTWAYTLLADFDKIDQFLADAHQLFDYMTEAKALERWRLQEIHEYAGEPENIQIKTTEKTEKYFRLWENLEEVYHKLRQRLSEKKQGYRGMMYRQVCDNADKLIDDESVAQYIFVGMNALSKSEEKLVRTLIKRGRAETLWDSDAYYMEANADTKAGEQLRRYKKSEKFGEWNWLSDDLLTGKKDFYYVAVPNATMQPKIATQIFRQFKTENPENKTSSEQTSTQPLTGKTAIVLPDENLLLPILNTLDEDIEDFNITMGLALRNSTLYTLLNLLFELQMTTALWDKEKDIFKFNHRSIVRVLTHPFIRQYESLFLEERKIPQTENGQLALFESNTKAVTETETNTETQEKDKNFIRNTINEIAENQYVFLTPEQLFELSENHLLFRILFSPWKDNPRLALNCFQELIDLLREVYKSQKNAIETEYLFLFYTFVQRLEQIITQRENLNDDLSMRSFRLFLNELFKQTKIPFGGEPDGNLQIMGMLETRTLDFDNVIFLSCNEKTLPQAKHQNSLIPFDAQIQFGLPGYQVQEATIAYHFYRLLQRAKNVWFLYLLPSETYGAGEKSRFLHQIESELMRVNPNIRLHEVVVQNKTIAMSYEPQSLKIEKTDFLLNKIKENFAKGVSPSQLNSYVNCTLQYYFNTVLRVREDRQHDATMDNDTFGTMVHTTLEEIAGELALTDKMISSDALQSTIPGMADRIKAVFARDFPNYSLENGMNYLYYKVAIRLVTKLIETQLEKEVFPIEVLGLETTLETSFDLNYKGETIHVKMTGRVDRIERTGNKIRIIDFKTGKVEKSALKMGSDNQAFLLTDPKGKEIRQLWIYKYILAKNLLYHPENQAFTLDNEVISPGIYSLRNLKEGFMESNIRLENEIKENLAIFIEESEIYISKLLSEILNPSEYFQQTTDLKTCEFCNYKNICKRT